MLPVGGVRKFAQHRLYTPMDDWMAELRAGRSDAAWDLFVARYRRLLIAAIRHYLREPDDVMDVFAWVCEALRDADMRRLRSYSDRAAPRARFSTWLVTIVHRLTVDWIRRRDGRRRLPAVVERLTPLRRRIFELVFVGERSHLEAFGLICTQDPPGPTYRAFLRELRATYEAVGGIPERASSPIIPLAAVSALPVPVEPTPAVELHDRTAWLGRALERLSAQERVAVELYVVEGLAAADIARVLGLPNAKAVYNRVYRALDALRAWLDDAGIGDRDL